MKLYVLTHCAAEENYTPKVFKTEQEAITALRNVYEDLVYDTDYDAAAASDNEKYVKDYVECHELYNNVAEIIYVDGTYDRLDIFEVEVEADCKADAPDISNTDKCSGIVNITCCQNNKLECLKEENKKLKEEIEELKEQMKSLVSIEDVIKVREVVYNILEGCLLGQEDPSIYELKVVIYELEKLRGEDFAHKMAIKLHI